MGCFAQGPFGNDTALDWLGGCGDVFDEECVLEAFAGAPSDTPLGAGLFIDLAVAAAALVAASVDRGFLERFRESELPSDKLLRSLPTSVSTELLASTVAAMKAIEGSSAFEERFAIPEWRSWLASIKQAVGAGLGVDE